MAFRVLSYRVSNPKFQNQNLTCYRYTIAQSGARKRCKDTHFFPFDKFDEIFFVFAPRFCLRSINLIIFALHKKLYEMKKSTTYIPQGVCSQVIDIVVEDGIVSSVQFVGGCSGNTQGVAALIRGMEIHEAIARLEGIDCRGRGTSCPDQLAQALKRIAD